MTKENNKRIKVSKDGPYIVSGNIPINHLEYIPDNHGASIEYKETGKYPEKATCGLCRCGKSQNKPYCDGSHLQGFDGTETARHAAYDEMAEHIKGKQMDLMDAEELCAGARFCDTKGGTWNLVTRSDYPQAKDIIEYQCTHCPSGRLTAVTKEGKRIEPDLPREISIIEDVAAHKEGPIWVKGGIEIEDSTGKIYPSRNRVTLCRCGKSENKPFCDGSHMEK